MVAAIGLLFALVAVAVAVLHACLAQLRKQEVATRSAFLAQALMEDFMQTREELVPREGRLEAPFEDYRYRLTVETREDMLALGVTVEGPAGGNFTLTTQRRARPGTVWFAGKSGGRAQIFRGDEDGLRLAPIGPDTGCNETRPAPSPDQSLLAFVSDRSGAPRILVAPLESMGRKPRELDDQGWMQAQLEPAWSPEGTELAFTAFGAGRSQLFLWTPREDRLACLSPPDAQDSCAAWSDDGWLAFVTEDPDGNSQIAVMRRDGSARRVLTTGQGWCGAPSWSPDGKTLVFMSNREGNPELYSMARTGGAVRRLTRDPGYDTDPHFSPDGRRILFCSDRSGENRLYEIPAQGGPARPILSCFAGWQRDAVWQP